MLTLGHFGLPYLWNHTSDTSMIKGMLTFSGFLWGNFSRLCQVKVSLSYLSIVQHLFQFKIHLFCTLVRKIPHLLVIYGKPSMQIITIYRYLKFSWISDIPNSFTDIRKSFRDIRNSFRDIRNSFTDIRNSAHLLCFVFKTVIKVLCLACHLCLLRHAF